MKSTAALAICFAMTFALPGCSPASISSDGKVKFYEMSFEVPAGWVEVNNEENNYGEFGSHSYDIAESADSDNVISLTASWGESTAEESIQDEIDSYEKAYKGGKLGAVSFFGILASLRTCI